MNKDDIASKVRLAIVRAFSIRHGTGAGSAHWTKSIKQELCIEGRNAGLRTTAHGVTKSDWGEWLYDVCWLKYSDACSPEKSLVDAELDFLEEAVLIVESEFGNLGDIRDDFHKLLVGRAIVRCMIWDCRPTKNEEVVEWLAEMVRSFSSTDANDFYLFAGYADNGFEFWHLDGRGVLR